MEKEFTTEESDALILQEMGLAEENSITNNDDTDNNSEEETEDYSEEETEEEFEYQEEDEESYEENNRDTSKPKKGIAKVLHQRNEARKEAEQAKSEVQKLQARLEELEAEGNFGNEEYVQTLVDKRIAERDELSDYFDNNPELRQFKNEIKNYAKEYNLNIDKATKLYLAEQNPNLLLDKETKNKQKSKMYGTPAITSKKVVSGKFEYTDAEFEELAKKGVIKF